MATAEIISTKAQPMANWVRMPTCFGTVGACSPV